MKKFLTASPFAVAAALVVLSSGANAQTVEMKGLGSSALFLESGLAASNTTGMSPISASCVWSSNGSVAGSTVAATDTKDGGSGVQDSGNAWVAWTPSSQPASATTCANITSATQVWSYLQTDSVVGDRCLFNAQSSAATCTITYPSVAAGVATANLIRSGSEFSLPKVIADALNSAKVNAAGTDIRPEDAEFAVARATTGCGTAIASSQYLGLRYNPADPTLSNIQSSYSTSVFHTTQFTLPTSYTVTPVGATPILVVVNGSSTGFATINNISSASLAQFLDGRNSFTNQALASPSASGQPVTVLIREPLSGTYNTMEYNVPNTTVNQTSQDVGKNQPVAQRNCDPVLGTVNNPLNIMTASGGHRRRAIGTGQELSEVLDTTNNGSDILGYGFWSVANFAPFAGHSSTHYLTVDGIDPLFTSSLTGNVIPTTGSSQLASVNLAHVQDGTYPIWSLLRFVTVDTTAGTHAQILANGMANFVSTGGTTSRPDFITPNQLTVVRSHFIPPAGAGEPTKAANGHVGLPSSLCAAAEAGGDVGGVVISLATDSSHCTIVKTGTTGERR